MKTVVIEVTAPEDYETENALIDDFIEDPTGFAVEIVEAEEKEEKA